MHVHVLRRYLHYFRNHLYRLKLLYCLLKADWNGGHDDVFY